LTIYSHHFSLSKLSPVGRKLANGFANRYVQFGLVPSGGRVVRKPIKVFAAANEDRTEYRFHINQLSDFYKMLLQNGYDNPTLYKTVKPGIKPTDKINFTVNEKFKPYDYQIPLIEYASQKLPVCKLVGLRTGGGKALKNTELIKIPNGWKQMGDVRVGDVITAKDGSPTTVTEVYPQGKVQLYKVEFADGRSVECCAEHLWEIFYIKTVEHRRWRIVNTEEMLRLISQKEPRVYISLNDPEDYPDVDLPIHPYLLGVILGDGCTRHNSIGITTPDESVIKECEKYIGDKLRFSKIKKSRDKDCPAYNLVSVPGYKNTNFVKEWLIKFGIMGKLSYEKTIPDCYLHASISQRLSLLQGLLDTDGTVSKSGSPSFSSTSYEMAKSVQYLVRSLGGIAFMSNRITNYTHKGEKKAGRRSYKVGIRFKKPSSLFRLSRKGDRINDNNQYANDLKLRVSSITPTTIDYAQCITIDHPDQLYVTTDFIVTHNTVSALTAIAKIEKIPCIVVRPAYIDKWVEDLIKTYGLTVDDIMVIQGGKHLTAFLTKVSEGSLEYKAVIISNRTFQLWLTMYERMKDDTLEMGYAIPPYEFFEFANCGVRLIDEVHQDFHFNFKLDLYTNVEYSISLSATLITNDPFIRNMHDIAYPIKDRCASPPLDKYINSFAVHYRFKNPDKIRTMEYGSKNYSHGAFEKSISKHVPTFYAYLGLIDYTLDIGFIQSTKKNKKCIIFAYSVDMCTKIAEHLENKYPDFIVNRYVADDDYGDLMNGDIIVSTLGSAGTAVDIPNLTNVILTTAIDSIQSNVQSLGRLRKLDNGDTDTQFHYFVCSDVPKHLEYHTRKKEMLAQRAKSFIDIYSGFVL
jgi:intein/homing endonuclease